MKIRTKAIASRVLLDEMPATSAIFFGTLASMVWAEHLNVERPRRQIAYAIYDGFLAAPPDHAFSVAEMLQRALGGSVKQVSSLGGAET